MVSSQQEGTTGLSWIHHIFSVGLVECVRRCSNYMDITSMQDCAMLELGIGYLAGLEEARGSICIYQKIKIKKRKVWFNVINARE